MTRREQAMLVVLALLTVLLLMQITRNPLLFRTMLVSPYSGLKVKRRSPTIFYEVFKPAIDPYNSLVNYFRPNNLRRVGCGLMPANPAKLPFGMLFGLARGCY